MPNRKLCNLVLVWLCLGFCLHPALAQQTLSPETNAVVQDLVVQIRELDRQSRQEVSRGCGVVVAGDETKITILTARHVVEYALADPPQTEVGVLFPGTRRWVDAELGKPLGPDETLDAAVLTVPSDWSPYVDHAPPVELLSLSPPPAAGDRLWAYGFNPGTQKMSIVSGQCSEPASGLVRFDAAGVVEGFSGGIVLNNLGVVGMTVRAGPDGKGHEALPGAILLDLLQAAGVAVKVKRNPVREALSNMLSRGLLGAMEMWYTKEGRPDVRTVWCAVYAASESGDTTIVRIVNPVEHTEYGFIATPDGLRMNPLSNPELRDAGRSEVADFKIEPKYAIPGFVVLSAEATEGMLFLALPSANSELLASRAIMSSITGFGRAILDDRPYQTLNAQLARRVGSELLPFSICAYSEMELDFTIPHELHGDKPVRILGRERIPSALLTAFDAETVDRIKRVWTTFRFQVIDIGTSRTEVASCPLLWRDADVAIGHGFVPSDAQYRLTHTAAAVPNFDYQGTHVGVVMLQALRIEYSR